MQSHTLAAEKTHAACTLDHGHSQARRGKSNSRYHKLLGKAVDVLANLGDQLSCRRHDESDGALMLLNGPLVLDVPQQGEHKRQRLPTACGQKWEKSALEHSLNLHRFLHRTGMSSSSREI